MNQSNQDDIPNELRDGIFPLQEEDRVVYTTQQGANWTTEDNAILYDKISIGEIHAQTLTEKEASDFVEKWNRAMKTVEGQRQFIIPVYSHNKILNWFLIKKWEIMNQWWKFENWYLTKWMFLKYRLTGRI